MAMQVPESPREQRPGVVPVESFRPQEVHVKPNKGFLQGQVVKYPRLVGAGCVGLSCVLALVSYAIYRSDHTYYVQLVVVTPIAATVGGWMVVFGQPLDPVTGKPRRWWQVGQIAMIFVGVILGIALCAELG